MKIIIFVLICSFVISHSSFIYAMGSKPSAKEKPKYKLEILKMEIITAPSPSGEASTTKSGAKH